MKFNIEFRPEWFGAYQLDVKKNFLEAPVCPCGCKEKPLAMLHTKDELFQFMENVLVEETCEQCGIFAYGLNGKMCAAIKLANTDSIHFIESETENEIKFFKDLDEALQLHQYALMIETQIGNWKVIEQ